eukprot:scaffold168_cov124-Cylindrotheca_fusiformis.AAC.17
MAYAMASVGLPAKVSALPAIKRRANSAALVADTARTSKRLSPSTLRAIFVAMLAAIALLYFLLVFFFFRRQDLQSYAKDSDWGPTLRSKSDIWQDHLDKLAQEKAKIDAIVDRPPARDGPVSKLKDLEDTDIHEMIRPEEIRRKRNHGSLDQTTDTQNNQQRLLTAYMEQVNMYDFEGDPLPIRRVSSSALIKTVTSSAAQSCQSLKDSLDDSDVDDPFLPRLQSVFPTDDGLHIQIEAQNSLPCRNNTTADDLTLLKKMMLQAALFQPVPVIKSENGQEIRYQLSGTTDTAQRGSMTRFICRFEPSGQETLSRFDSQNSKDEIELKLRFQCPVPQSLVDAVRDGTSVIMDQPSLFLTLVPIRTPPRMDATTKSLPPCYLNAENLTTKFSSSVGEAHLLPKIEDSGRWENIPICLPKQLSKEAVAR